MSANGDTDLSDVPEEYRDQVRRSLEQTSPETDTESDTEDYEENLERRRREVQDTGGDGDTGGTTQPTFTGSPLATGGGGGGGTDTGTTSQTDTGAPTEPPEGVQDDIQRNIAASAPGDDPTPTEPESSQQQQQTAEPQQQQGGSQTQTIEDPESFGVEDATGYGQAPIAREAQRLEEQLLSREMPGVEDPSDVQVGYTFNESGRIGLRAGLSEQGQQDFRREAIPAGIRAELAQTTAFEQAQAEGRPGVDERSDIVASPTGGPESDVTVGLSREAQQDFRQEAIPARIRAEIAQTRAFEQAQEQGTVGVQERSDIVASPTGGPESEVAVGLAPEAQLEQAEQSVLERGLPGIDEPADVTARFGDDADVQVGLTERGQREFRQEAIPPRVRARIARGRAFERAQERGTVGVDEPSDITARVTGGRVQIGRSLKAQRAAVRQSAFERAQERGTVGVDEPSDIQTRVTDEGVQALLAPDALEERRRVREVFEDASTGILEESAQTIDREVVAPLAETSGRLGQLGLLSPPSAVSVTTGGPSRQTQAAIGAGVGQGIGAIGNVPRTLLETGEAAVFAGEGVASLAPGGQTPQEFVDEQLYPAAAAVGARIEENPVRFGGALLGSTVASAGVIGAASRVGGGFGRATSTLIQPGEEAAIALGSRVPAVRSAVTRIPGTGVREGMFRDADGTPAGERGQLDLTFGFGRRGESEPVEITGEDIAPPVRGDPRRRGGEDVDPTQEGRRGGRRGEVGPGGMARERATAPEIEPESRTFLAIKRRRGELSEDVPITDLRARSELDPDATPRLTQIFRSGQRVLTATEPRFDTDAVMEPLVTQPLDVGVESVSETAITTEQREVAATEPLVLTDVATEPAVETDGRVDIQPTEVELGVEPVTAPGVETGIDTVTRPSVELGLRTETGLETELQQEPRVPQRPGEPEEPDEPGREPGQEPPPTRVPPRTESTTPDDRQEDEDDELLFTADEEAAPILSRFVNPLTGERTNGGDDDQPRLPGFLT